MDWADVFGRLGVERLARLATSAGLSIHGRQRKADLVALLTQHLDEALKHEALSLLGIAQLREVAAEVRLPRRPARKQELIAALVLGETEDVELELSEVDLLLPDRFRRDLPEGHGAETAIDTMPSRPDGADAALAIEVLHLLRRPRMHRAVIAMPSCDSALLSRLVCGDLDDLIESAMRERAPGETSPSPVITFVLDGGRHALRETAAGNALATLAARLRGAVEIRLTERDRVLAAQVLAFEESRVHGPFFTAIVGGAAPALTVLPMEAADAPRRARLEANLRVAGAIESSATPCSLVKEWVAHLLRETRSLTAGQLEALPLVADVTRKIDYKLAFDTAHELALKHLAEHICRRGRFAAPLFDPSALEPPAPHQHAAVSLAAEPWCEGVLLLDDAGLGKTIEAGLVLARELRRRRVYASPVARERRRALVIAPTSLHGHWREELTAKLGLEVAAIDASDPLGTVPAAQVLICGPRQLAERLEDLAGIELLCVDEPLLYDEDEREALKLAAQAAERCLVLSSEPAYDDPSDLAWLAALARPAEGWEHVMAVEGAGERVAFEVSAFAARARREDGGLPSPRRVFEDRSYDLDPVEIDVYEELRRMRRDYVERARLPSVGGNVRAGAFAALEHTFLSSAAAFMAAASRILGQGEDGDLFVKSPGDRSLSFFRTSSYFKRRLGRLAELMTPRARPQAEICAKEAALFSILSGCRKQAVVVMTRYRATAARLATVLSRARVAPIIELVDGASSLRERRAVVARFRERAAVEGPPTEPRGVLVVTDAAAEELALHDAAAVLVSYDLPQNPQLIERRIARMAKLSRRGGDAEVVIHNLAARHPAIEGWTIDSRVLYACRALFGMDRGAPSPALFEIEPEVLEARLAAGEAAELSLLEEPDPEVVSPVDAWLNYSLAAAPRGEATAAAIVSGTAEDARLRAELADFWARVSHAPRPSSPSLLAGARGYLFARLQQALLQGMVGVLCAPDRSIDDCDGWTLVIGLRLLLEAAVVRGQDEPSGEAWLIEDEVVYLWAVSPEGQLLDWAEFLLGEGLVEVPAGRATPLVSDDVLEFLSHEKRAIEARGLDAVPLATWLRSAPEALRTRLDVIHRHATALADARQAELSRAWDEARTLRIERLETRCRDLEQRGAADALRASRRALDRAKRQRVELRHEVLGTQLFIVTH